ncbi:MAG: ErfK/YbiS/YcfS/YnhG family protein [Chloroflexi bacterium OLB14]|nr:MAG: ErfK/YbiS/YcfS/YnhG family protein [Chloroflexi bacterium OLB14]
MLKKFLSLLITLTLLNASWGLVRAQTPETKYFNETGHNVSGDFLTFYNSNPNAYFLYGYPITEQFSSRDGKTVQYFQRARFELIPENPAGQRVQLTAIGRETFSSTGTIEVNNFFACRLYAETGYSVCLEFLEFFDTYGGVAQFGYPISGFEYHENKLVQYFEKARLEWQPNMLAGQRVVVSNLGYEYFNRIGEDPALQYSVTPLNNAPRVVTSLLVRAFSLKAVTLPNDTQSFFIVVQDQNNLAIANATCTANVMWPNQASASTTIITNTLGIGIISLQFENQPLGSLISVNVTCNYDVLSAETTTSFRIWY